MFNKRAISLKQRLAAGKVSSGIWMSLPSPTACEIVADAGFDWIIVDAEHSPFSPETRHSILMAFKGSDTVPIIRVGWNDQVMIKQALDMGWDGVVVPQVNSVQEARRAVSACRYPPRGRRGFGPLRASNYHRDEDKYVKYANDSVICTIQIEDVSAVDEIEEIVRIPGIDWIIVGPCDMSGTTGRFLDLDDPELLKAIQKIFDVAQAAGIPTGNGVTGVENIERQLDLNYQLVHLGEDITYLKESADKALKTFHNTIKRSNLNC